MMGSKEFEWSKETYEKSISSKCWWYTAYDAGWEESKDYGHDLSADDELRQIVQMEHELGSIPDWARQIVEGAINFVPCCGHPQFPRAYLEAVSAIGAEAPPAFVHGCYTADRHRKERMVDYLFCLDAWLAGADAQNAAGELTARGSAGIDWTAVCADLWRVLGERTELKELLVERLLHRQRWWVKSLVWDDDARDLFLRDQYLGDTICDGDHYGNPAFKDPFFTEREVPRVKRLEARLAELCTDWQWFKDNIDCSWLCAMKAFRYLERMLRAIGKERPPEDGEQIPGFLRCEDTYPNHDEAAEWWKSFLAALQGWWQGYPGEGDVADDVSRRLGEPTPVKRWLVRLFVRRLELHAQDAETRRLVNPGPGARRGEAALTK